MQLFEVYEHPRWGLRAVRQGFSWPAFLAPSVWAAARGLGTLTLLLVVCSTLLFDLLKVAAPFVGSSTAMLLLFVAAYVAFGLKPGLRASAWHAAQLERDGYRRRATVAADGRRAAIGAVQRGEFSAPLLVAR